MENLASVYRPHGWEQLVGQRIIADILKYQIDNNNIANVYLFCGGAGTGKTTSARIFAEQLTNNNKMNIIEINASSNNGVDDIRGIIDDCRFQVIMGNYKVYIVDECHMLSQGAWNSMLKLLEEPPKNVIFILCTTDPQKIPATIISRVQRYDFKRIPTDMICERLKYIVAEENKKGKNYSVDDSAIKYIARIVNGGMRDAITLLDKCLSYKTNLTEKDVLEIINVVNYPMMIDLLSQLKARETKNVIDIIEKENSEGKDLKQLITQLTNFITEIYKFYLSKSIKNTELSEAIEAELNQKGEQFFIYCRSLLFIFSDLSNQIKYTQYPKMQIECTLIKICEEYFK